MKSEIFFTAWQFQKQTGAGLSECLKKAWAVIKLKNRMQKEIVKFYFQKVNGETREAWGTLRPDLIPAAAGSDRRKDPTIQTFFDTEKKQYRCFKKFNLIAA